jgi:hypothetical protein
MTLAQSTRYRLYQPVVLTTDFAVPFPIFSQSDVSVFIDGVETNLFSVTATFSNGRSENAVVNLNTAVTDVDVEVFGARSPRRENDYLGNSPRLSDNLQNDVDAVTAVQQEQSRDYQSTMRVSSRSPITTPLSGDAASRAKKVLAFSEDGSGLTTGPDLDTINNAQSFAERSEAAAANASLGTPYGFETVAAFLADDSTSIPVGQYVLAGGFRYQVAAQAAPDAHVTNAAGTPFYVDPDPDGYYAVEAFGVLGDGSAGDLARAQRAADATPNLRWQSKTYVFNENVATPSGYGSHQRACIIATGSVAWRSAGTTTLKVSDALQGGAQANDTAILFMEDQDQFSAPGFTFDENAGAQGYGAPLALYGVLDVDLDRITVRNANPLRIGASATRLCGEVRGGMSGYNPVGTFVVGGKPGGAKTWRDLSCFVSGGRGGVNIEAEDADNRGLTHITDGYLKNIVGEDIHGGASPVEFLKIEDGARRVECESVTLTDATSTGTSRATAVSVKEGQDSVGMERVSIGRIGCTNIESAVYVEMMTQNQGDLLVGDIQGNDTGSFLTALNTHGAGSGQIASIILGRIQGNAQSPHGANSGTAISVDSNPSSENNNAFAPHVGRLEIGGGHLRSVRERTFDVRGVERFECKGLTVDAHLANPPSGDYSGTIYNIIEADEIVLTDTVLRGFAGTEVPLELRPKKTCILRGLDLRANGSGTALFINGSGSLLIDGCRFGGATNALNFRQGTLTFDASVVNDAQNRIEIAHGFLHGEQVQYNTTGTAIPGLTPGNYYFVNYISATQFQLSLTQRGSNIDFFAGAAGSQTLKKAINVVATNNRNECTNFAANTGYPLSWSPTGTW